MIAVIFEVQIQDGKKQNYLDVAAELKPLLYQIDGFISIERFSSLQNPEKVLSLSFWRDEQAIEAWRNLEQHRIGQAKGRNHIFLDYRIRVGHILRDYGLNSREQAPKDSNQIHK
ncbi:antibiotic biosynthesis monooxygenase [bacterium SCSIO 12643]|nr:antibiotic biosynthesis monooxygenase [bacterium SCSIO 12643]